MPIFRKKVALEACPAKTAESISYGATFVVLSWLLASNYSGLGNAKSDTQPLASSDSLSTKFTDTETLNRIESLAITLPPQEAESGTFDPTLPTWHSKIRQLPLLESRPHSRVFSPTAWNEQAGAVELQFESAMEGLDLGLPLLGADYVFNPLEHSNTGTPQDLASNTPTENKLVREITVTGTETRRLSTRPDNTQRPQIPRPYRAQKIQRTLVLPPRIQALRP